ncbi:hypothetical protein TIFTF001_024817 [Ficus carica]|uniref:Uncharacterized protein n=1 Tax=Ficus carica TaxID=3494 RepID=A0AA88AN27_FICCA|nr:hypothetical protein TIFTF001_024817 [Ficus carica]
METDEALSSLWDMPLTPSNWSAVWDSDILDIFNVPPLSPLSPHPSLGYPHFMHRSIHIQLGITAETGIRKTSIQIGQEYKTIVRDRHGNRNGDEIFSPNSKWDERNTPTPSSVPIHDCTKKLNLPQGLQYLPDELRYLCWENYPLRSLPQNFIPEKLVELLLEDSKLEKLWDGVQNLGSLKILNLQRSENLTEIPDLSLALNLEELHLSYCGSLEHLPTSTGKLESLQ